MKRGRVNEGRGHAAGRVLLALRCVQRSGEHPEEPADCLHGFPGEVSDVWSPLSCLRLVNGCIAHWPNCWGSVSQQTTTALLSRSYNLCLRNAYEDLCLSLHLHHTRSTYNLRVNTTYLWISLYKQTNIRRVAIPLRPSLNTMSRPKDVLALR